LLRGRGEVIIGIGGVVGVFWERVFGKGILREWIFWVGLFSGLRRAVVRAYAWCYDPEA
jgi:hypothetical protein